MPKDMNQQIAAVRTDLELLKVNVDDRFHSVMIEFARARGEIQRLEVTLRSEMRAQTNLILKRFDDFAGKWDDNRYHLAKHGERLEDHERRIARIESKRD